jgi:hypothetical protein
MSKSGKKSPERRKKSCGAARKNRPKNRPQKRLEKSLKKIKKVVDIIGVF